MELYVSPPADEKRITGIGVAKAGKQPSYALVLRLSFVKKRDQEGTHHRKPTVAGAVKDIRNGNS